MTTHAKRACHGAMKKTLLQMRFLIAASKALVTFAALPTGYGAVAQSVRALPCHGRGCGFESRPFRQWKLKNSESLTGLAFLLREGGAAVPMDCMREPTAFELKVYDATSCIPRGQVATYATIGKIIGCRSAQAIGQALSRNPMAPVVPCHRVIRSDLTLGGFSGELTGPETQRKLKLLEAEGVGFKDGKLVDASRVWKG